MSSEALCEKEKETEIELSPKKRLFIFVTLVLIATVSSFDGGIIPQATTTLTKDWATDDLTVGYFGASDYIGRVVGSLLLAYMINQYERKKLLIFSLFFKGILMTISIFCRNFVVNIVARGLSGMSQVFYTSYFPVWGDQFAETEMKSLWVMLVQVGNPLGIILGYGLSTLLSVFGFGYDEKNDTLNFGEWRIAFGIEGVVLVLFGILCVNFENVYFDKNFVLVGKNKGKIEKDENKEFLFFRNFCKILKNPLYLFTTLATSILYFGLEILQFWGNNYLKEYKEISSKSKLFLFNVICVSGPTLGVASGGIITSKLGGYSKKKAIYFALFLSIFCSFCGLLISEVPKENNLVIFCLVVWLFYLFLGGMIPPEAGIIIASLPKELKGDGFTVTNFICNLIGSVPSPFAFPFFKDVVFENDEKQWPKAMFVCMVINCLNTVFIVVATVFRIRLSEDLDKSLPLITNIVDSNENDDENFNI